MHILSLWARAGLGGENLAFFSMGAGGVGGAGEETAI